MRRRAPAREKREELIAGRQGRATKAAEKAAAKAAARKRAAACGPASKGGRLLLAALRASGGTGQSNMEKRECRRRTGTGTRVVRLPPLMAVPDADAAPE